MTMRPGAGVGLAAFAVLIAMLAGCTGGQESSAAEEKAPQKDALAADGSAAEPGASIDAKKQLKSIHRAIPIYAGAKYRDDLTRRDTVMIRSQYGANAQVYTLATDDSYPQVYHYYTTYLSQFRAYAPGPPYPPQQNWRSLEVQLNSAMQDPFIPGDTIGTGEKYVILQVAETEAEPKTVIRYIVTSAPPAPATAAAAGGGP